MRVSSSRADSNPVVVLLIPAVVLFIVVAILVATVTTSPATASPPQSATAPTQLDSCTVITESGRYVLSSDVENSADTCIEIRADDVTLDGRNHVLGGNGNNGSSGVTVQQASNVTVRNLFVTGWGRGLVYSNTTDGTVLNVVVVNNGRFGIRLVDATATRLTNVTAFENIDPETRPFPGPSKSAGIFVVGSDDTRIVDANVTRNVGGISLVATNDTVITDSIATSNEVGFFLRGDNDAIQGSVAGGNTVGFFADNASNSTFSNASAVSNRVGVGVENSSNATISDLDATSNLLGVSVVFSRGVDILETTTADNFVGVNFLGSHRNSLVESTVEANEFIGIGLVDANRTRLSNTTVAATTGNSSVPGATSAGVYLNGSSARFDDLTFVDNENWTVYAEADSTLDVSNLSLDGTRLSFDGENVGLDSTRQPSLPPGRTAIGRSFVVSPTATDAALDLQIGYDRRAVSTANVDERTIRLWRYDGGWSQIGNSRVVPDREVVVANLSQLDRSVFAVLGERTESTEKTATNVSESRQVAHPATAPGRVLPRSRVPALSGRSASD
ncbi:right-handed parallel beta-helix repeat-containing protein [Haladaptatus sp. NG-SE-30]